MRSRHCGPQLRKHDKQDGGHWSTGEHGEQGQTKTGTEMQLHITQGQTKALRQSRDTTATPARTYNHTGMHTDFSLVDYLARPKSNKRSSWNLQNQLPQLSRECGDKVLAFANMPMRLLFMSEDTSLLGVITALVSYNIHRLGWCHRLYQLVRYNTLITLVQKSKFISRKTVIP